MTAMPHTPSNTSNVELLLILAARGAWGCILGHDEIKKYLPTPIEELALALALARRTDVDREINGIKNALAAAEKRAAAGPQANMTDESYETRLVTSPEIITLTKNLERAMERRQKIVKQVTERSQPRRLVRLLLDDTVEAAATLIVFRGRLPRKSRFFKKKWSLTELAREILSDGWQPNDTENGESLGVGELPADVANRIDILKRREEKEGRFSAEEYAAILEAGTKEAANVETNSESRPSPKLSSEDISDLRKIAEKHGTNHEEVIRGIIARLPDDEIKALSRQLGRKLREVGGRFKIFKVTPRQQYGEPTWVEGLPLLFKAYDEEVLPFIREPADLYRQKTNQREDK